MTEQAGNSRVKENNVETVATTVNKMKNSLNLRTMFPRKVLNLPRRLPSLGLHRPLPNFSVSRQSRLFALKPLKVGRLDEIFLFDLEKKPSFLVEKLGYPITASLRAFAAAQVTSFEEPFIFTFLRDESFLLGECSDNPGVVQPPPGCGDGVLDKDISGDARNGDGLSGMGGRGWAKARAGRSDVALEL